MVKKREGNEKLVSKNEVDWEDDTSKQKQGMYPNFTKQTIPIGERMPWNKYVNDNSTKIGQVSRTSVLLNTLTQKNQKKIGEEKNYASNESIGMRSTKKSSENIYNGCGYMEFSRL